ncbi:MAG TPA: hypothetical protein VHE59_15400 [Mucilaginibacter sp.]|nr:hypothetical protein [Mucilaginibacter sp.]
MRRIIPLPASPKLVCKNLFIFFAGKKIFLRKMPESEVHHRPEKEKRKRLKPTVSKRGDDCPVFLTKIFVRLQTFDLSACCSTNPDYTGTIIALP